MKTYLVTGGCGFIGSHLVETLRAEGAGVRVLDDLSTGRRSNLPAGVDLLEGSITDAGLVRDALQDVAGCFHLAAIASVQRCTGDWPGTQQVNQTGTVMLLDAIRQSGHRIPFVYASSAAVYGDNAALPLTETSATRPLSAYGADKLGCELHAGVAGASFGVPTAGLRFFNVFGTRQDPASPYSGVISVFCDRLSRGQSVTVFGDGSQTRDFVSVRDVVAALRAAESHAAADAPVFNVCTGRPTTVLALAQTIASLLEVEPDIRFAPARAGEIRHSLGSPAKARAVLDLPEPMTLRDGLATVLDWMQPAGLAPTKSAR